MQSCIEVQALACHLGSRAALLDVDVFVAPGQVHGLLGPRWAGKTTLLRVLAGELAPSAGGALMPAHVAFVSEAGRSQIEARLDRGTAQRVALARAVAGAPDVLLVDEPADGFDAATEAATQSLVCRYTAQGGVVVWAARRLDALVGIASGVTLLAGGRVRYSGTVEALVSRALAGHSLHPAGALRHAA